MSKTITALLVGATFLAPLYLSAPAEAQSQRHIQRLEERVQEAKNRGDWNRAGELERQLNRDRLQYQRRHGMGEANTNSGFFRFNLGDSNRGYYNNGYYNDGYNNRGYYNPYDNRDYNRGYYDRWGRWHSY